MYSHMHLFDSPVVVYEYDGISGSADGMAIAGLGISFISLNGRGTCVCISQYTLAKCIEGMHLSIYLTIVLQGCISKYS